MRQGDGSATCDKGTVLFVALLGGPMSPSAIWHIIFKGGLWSPVDFDVEGW